MARAIQITAPMMAEAMRMANQHWIANVTRFQNGISIEEMATADGMYSSEDSVRSTDLCRMRSVRDALGSDAVGMYSCDKEVSNDLEIEREREEIEAESQQNDDQRNRTDRFPHNRTDRPERWTSLF